MDLRMWFGFSLTLAWTSHCTGSRILLLCDEVKSRQGVYATIADELVNRGHEVFWLLNGEAKFSKTFTGPGKHAIFFSGLDLDLEQFYDHFSSTAISNPGNIRAIYSEAFEFTKKIATILLMKNEAAFTELEEANIDIAVVDGLFLTNYKYLVAHRLGVPFVTTSDFFEPWHTRVPWLPSFIPLSLVPYSHEMTFFQRLKNTALYVAARLVDVSPALSLDIVEKYSEYGSFSSPADISAKSKLWILTSDPVLDYPKPLMANMIEAGGISSKPAKPLDRTWTIILQESTNGVVLVSYGSVASSFPEDMATKLLTAFGQLQQTVIFRFKNKDNLSIPPNVLISDWLPQNDLMADHNIKVYVTHCGNNGQYEAVYHGVPMIAMPLFGDQFYNAKRVEYRGFGIHVDVFNFQPDDLVSAIHRVITDPSYKQRITKASMIFRDRPETPVQRAVSGIEQIVKYGGDHLQSYSAEMPLHQFLMLDVLALFLLCVLFGVFIGFRILICVFKLCFKQIDQRKSKKQ